MSINDFKMKLKILFFKGQKLLTNKYSSYDKNEFRCQIRC